MDPLSAFVRGSSNLRMSLVAALLSVLTAACDDLASTSASPSVALSELPAKADALDNALADGGSEPAGAHQHEHGETGHDGMGDMEMMSPAVGRGMMGKMPSSGAGMGMMDPSMKGGMKNPSMKGGMMDPPMKGGMKDPPMKGGMKDPPMKGGMKDPSMKGGMKDPSMGDAMFSSLHHAGESGFFLDHATKISLTDSQKRQLNELKQDALLATASAERKIDEAEQELWIMTAEAEPDVAKIHDKTSEIAAMTVKRRLGFIRAVAKAATLLTDEQRNSLVDGAGTPTKPDAMPEGNMPKTGGKMADGKKPPSDKMPKMAGDKMPKMAGDKMPKMASDKMPEMAGDKMPSDELRKKPMKEKMASRGMAMMGMNPATASTAMGEMSLPSSLPGFPGASHLYHVGATGFFLDHAESIALSDAQRLKLEKILEEADAALETAQASIDEAEHELWQLTAEADPSDEDLEAKVKQIARLYVERRMAFIRSVGAAAEVLTKKQRDIVVGESAP